MMLKAIIEALIFASGRGIPRREIYEGLKDKFVKRDIDKALQELMEQYSGESGIHIIEFNNTFQMQTNPDYGELLADLLKETKERELSRTLLQVLAIIVYKQPITRTEIEALRGSSPDYVMSMLLKLNLIEPKGRKDTIGHPILYGTTDEFLKKFGISDYTDLPQYDEIMQQIKNNYDKFHARSSNLYKEVKSISDFDDGGDTGADIIRDEFVKEQTEENEKASKFNRSYDGETAATDFSDAPSDGDDIFADEESDNDDMPDFLSGEDTITIE